MARRAGFTLIEIMAVMVIIAIALVSVVPALDNLLPSYRLRSGGRHLAGNIEVAQSEAIGRRKEFVLAYDLDRHTYWIVMPPEEPEEEGEQQQDEGLLGGLLGGGGDEEKTAGTRPEDDVEHGEAPPDPADAAQQEQEVPDDFTERDALEPQPLPDDIEFEAVIVGDEEKRTGTVYVPVNHQGDAGAHIIGLKVKDSEDRVWVKFNPMTRTVEYSDERPQLRTLSPGGERP